MLDPRESERDRSSKRSRCSRSSREVFREFRKFTRDDEKKLVPNFHGWPVVKPPSRGYISIELNALKRRSLPMFVTVFFLNFPNFVSRFLE